MFLCFTVFLEIKNAERKRQAKNVPWLQASKKRLCAGAMLYTETKLTRTIEFLNGRLIRSEIINEKHLEADNIRYTCEDLGEFSKRTKLKRRVQRKGFVDLLHLKTVLKV